MRAGLVASTVTPGSTAPDVSLRTPAMPLVCCASAVPDANIRHVDVIKPIQRAVRVMVCLPGTWRPAMTATLLFANVVRVYIPRHTGCQAGMDSRDSRNGQQGQQEWTAGTAGMDSRDSRNGQQGQQEWTAGTAGMDRRNSLNGQ